MNAQAPLYIRPKRALEVFGVHKATLYRWAAAGHIRIYKRGAASFFRVAEIENFITGEGGGPAGGPGGHGERQSQ